MEEILVMLRNFCSQHNLELTVTEDVSYNAYKLTFFHRETSLMYCFMLSLITVRDFSLESIYNMIINSVKTHMQELFRDNPLIENLKTLCEDNNILLNLMPSNDIMCFKFNKGTNYREFYYSKRYLRNINIKCLYDYIVDELISYNLI